MALPFEKAAERARADAREAIRGLAVLTEGALAAAHGPGRKATKALLALENAVVELKKQHAILAADLKYLERIAPAHAGERAAAIAAQRRLQEECVEVAAAALAQLEWKRAQANAASHIGKAGEALARARLAADRAAALAPDALARRCQKVVADLDGHMTAAKRAIAITIADEKRFAPAAAAMRDPANNDAYPPRPADPQTMAGALVAQKTAVDDLKEQLRSVNDRIEALKRDARRR